MKIEVTKRENPVRLWFVNRPGGNPTTVRLMKSAAKKRGVEFVEVNQLTFDYSDKSLNFSKNDLLYNASKEKSAKAIEKFLLTRHPTSFYKSRVAGILKADNVVEATIIHQSESLPVPKTVYGTSKNREVLKKNIKYLGGFPIIIKAKEGSHGIGVMKVDSFSSLFSVLDYLNEKDDYFIMREFIDVRSSARLIVLGDRVIDSIEYIAPKGDFRSNEGKVPNVRARKFPNRINDIAIKAINVLGWETGGVDILIDKNNKPYLLEVNFPCFFPRCQLLSKVGIAGMMVDYLVEKSSKS